MKTKESRFQVHDELTAPERSLPVLKAAIAGGGQLSNFLGVPGELKHPKYLGAVKRIAAAANKHGRVLATAAPDEIFAKEYAALGFRMFFFGTDAHLLQSALARRIAAMREGGR